MTRDKKIFVPQAMPVWPAIPLAALIVLDLIAIILTLRNLNRWEDLFFPAVTGSILLLVIVYWLIHNWRMERAPLEEHNRLFQGILRSTSDGILAVNQENKVLFANERFVEMWKIPQELMALNDDSLLVQYVVDQLREPQIFLQKVQDLYKSTEESFDTIYFKDGRVFDRLSRPMLQGKEVRGRVWSFRDITERKQTEQRLLQAEENYRKLFDNSLNGIFRSTPEGRYIMVNPALARIWAYDSPEDLIASVADIARQVYVDTDGRARHTRLLKEQGGTVTGFEYQAFRKDGSIVWVSENVRSVMDADGALLYYEGSVEDITARKQVEVSLRKRNEYFAALQRITMELLDRNEVKSLLETICEKAASLLDADHGFIFLDDGDALLLRAATENLAHHIDEREKKPGSGVLGQVWQTGKPIRVEYYETWEFRDPNYSNDKLRAAAGVPILHGESMAGVLVVARMVEDNRVFTDDDMDILSHFAELASLVLDNVSLYESALNEIAVRKSAQEAVGRAEARYRALFEEAPAMYVITRNVEGNPVIADCNEQFSRTLGFGREEMLGRPVADLYSPASRKLLVEGGYQRALAGEFLTEERELLTRDGHIVQTMVRAVPEVDATGLVSGTRAMFVDITERKRAEEALQKAEEKYRNFFENSIEGIFQTTPEGRIISANPAMADILGYDSPEELISCVTDLDHQLYVEPARRAELKKQLDEKGRVSSFESEVFRKDGSRMWMVNNILAVREKDGRPLYYEGTLVDITARKQIEQTQRDAQQAQATWISELERRTRQLSLLNEMSDLIQCCPTVEEAYSVISQQAQWIFPQESGALYVLCESRNLAEPMAAWGEPLKDESAFSPTDCWAFRRGQIHSADTEVTKNHWHGKPVLICSHLQNTTPAAYICVPLIAQGETLGVLHLRHNIEEESNDGLHDVWYTEARKQLAHTVADSLALAISNLRLRDSLRQQSIRDPLTGMFNRRYMEESLDREVARAVRAGRPLSVIMVDIDHFKHFNDMFGHEAGDAVLRELGVFFRSQIREADIACRYGGEEFALILPDASLEITKARAEKIREEVKQLQVKHRGHLLGAVTLSLGIAEIPRHGSTGGGLIRTADAALYRAKKTGRDRVVIGEFQKDQEGTVHD